MASRSKLPQTASCLSLVRFALVALLAGATPCAEPHPRPGQDAVVAPHACPCSALPKNPSPKPQVVTEGKPVELGMLFRVNAPGFATAVRFFKANGAGGLHVGHLWNSKGEALASVAFRGESQDGWQEARLDVPIALDPGKDYTVSYFSPDGTYAFTQDFFSTDFRTAHVTVPAEGGHFVYAPRPGFPVSSFRAANYWVDLVFNETPPAEGALSLAPSFPLPDQKGIAAFPRISGVFTRPMQPETVSSATVHLLDPKGASVPGEVEYRENSRLLTLRPLQSLAFETLYTVQVLGGISGPRDISGNILERPPHWTFTTGAPPLATDALHGPILVLTSASHPFSTYLPEILRAEGLNEFRTLDIEQLNPAMLKAATSVVLGAIPVTDGQMETLRAWVSSGGKLIAMRPDAHHDSFYGIEHRAGTISNGYFRIDTGRAPGAGLTPETMQFHGVADTVALAGATSLATLYSDAEHATNFPALTSHQYGKGMTFAFPFDLARSIVLTRQGNPLWSGMERDGVAPIRSDDLFYGAARSDSTADWVDFTKVQIPQADELQRLFANLIVESARKDLPLPRFWYFPRDLKAVVVMTGDDHGKGNTVNRFENALAASVPNCSLENWECVRASGYLFPNSLTRDQATRYAADGFDLGVHVSTDCADWPAKNLTSGMTSIYQKQLSEFSASFPKLPKPATSRTHCIAWGDYDTQPRVEADLGIRLDTNYYYWPQEWIQDRPGLFTGSGMPMLFATRTGNPIHVYQAATFLTDESGQSYPRHIDVLLDNALGPRGFYGAFTANMHADLPESPQADAILSSALAHNVPVISAKQLLDWLEARNGSRFENIVWNGGKLEVSVSPAAGAYGLEVLIPARSGAGHLAAVSHGDQPIAFTLRTIKGIEYAAFPAVAGRFVANYQSRSGSK